MYNKTSGSLFLQYGKTINSDDIKHIEGFTENIVEIKDKNINSLFVCDDHVIIECLEGIASLCVSKSDDVEDVRKFVLHRVVKLYKDMYFNILSLTDSTRIRILYPKQAKLNISVLEEPVSLKCIKKTFDVTQIYSYYYNVKRSGYTFPGEKHQYFELTYVDNGELTVVVEGETKVLHDGELLIFGPNQFHSQANYSDKPCSYLTIMFELNIQNYEAIVNRVFKVSQNIHLLLGNFSDENKNAALPYKCDLMIRYLEYIIISLLNFDHAHQDTKISTSIHQHFEQEMLNEILTYIQNNLYKELTIDEICQKFNVSRSSLQNMFKENLNMPPKQYINQCKLKKSQYLIKESTHNIGEIAAMLGFNSIHYFSRKFKQYYHVTPTEYAKSIYHNDE